MANTYTHRIVSLKKEDGLYLNIVKSFIIEVTASDGTNQISKEYTINLGEPKMYLEPETAPDNEFIEYADLEESDLISWYENNVIEKEYIVKDIDIKLRESTQDFVESNFPWS